MQITKPALYTSLSPALLHLYDVSRSIVVIIDVLRATSTIATVLYNGAKHIIPVDSVAECIRIGKQIEGITAGERDGRIAEGLVHGNSPFEYPREFIKGKTLVLTTTNGIGKGSQGDYYGIISKSYLCMRLPNSYENAGNIGLRCLEGPGKY
jgi:2-phosphosulfolactate phosphatase